MHTRPLTLTLTLALTATAPAAFAQTTRLTTTGAPTGATLRVDARPSPDPATADVTGGGAVEHPGCGGFVAARPQVVLTVTAEAPWLRVYAASERDTSIAILGPNGQWRCADDTYGVNPSVDGRFRRGTYRVWVGTPARGDTASATVTVTAQRAQRPSEAPVAITSAPAGGAYDPSRDPVRAATGLAQQVLGGFGNAPSSPLDAVLRQQDAGVVNLSPAQLAQLSDLARAGLDAQQLQSVAGALTGARGAQPTLTPAQLTQLADLARSGASPERLQSTVGTMLRGVGTAR